MDQDKVNEFLGRVVTDFSAVGAAGLAVIGHRLGLYRALAQGPATPEQFAERTGCNGRYLTEWLRGQAAGGYVNYDPATGEFSMTEEQAFCLTDPNGPNLPAAFLVGLGYLRAEPRITEAFRTGEGIGWHEHHEDVHVGVDAFFRPGYEASLVPEWIPALDGIEEKLLAGGRVSDRVAFEVATAQTFTGENYDLVTMFDALHDMGDPLGAAKRIREALAPDGTWLVVEPYASEKVEENFNPVGRLYYNASVFLCTPNALSQSGGYALGTQAGESAVRQVVTDAGFTPVRRAGGTPFNLLFQV